VYVSKDLTIVESTNFTFPNGSQIRLIPGQYKLKYRHLKIFGKDKLSNMVITRLQGTYEDYEEPYHAEW